MTTESDRISVIRKHLKGNLADLLMDDYQGVAIHSNSIIVDVNACAAEMFGYAANEMIGLNAWTLFSPESVDALLSHLIQKSEDAYQVWARRKDGSLFMVELKGRDSELAGEPIRTVLLKEVS